MAEKIAGKVYRRVTELDLANADNTYHRFFDVWTEYPGIPPEEYPALTLAVLINLSQTYCGAGIFERYLGLCQDTGKTVPQDVIDRATQLAKGFERCSVDPRISREVWVKFDTRIFGN